MILAISDSDLLATERRQVVGQIWQGRSRLSFATARPAGALYGSLVERLARTGDIRALPFDAAACARATLDDLSLKKVADFLRLAQSRRGFSHGKSLRPSDCGYGRRDVFPAVSSCL
jgi:hypothetical protein